jgi:[protein-PII] uridylyltransferase
MLFLLSMADARATGPTVWNEWKAALLLELYLKIAHLLDRDDLVDPDRIQGVNWMRDQLSGLLDVDDAFVLEVLPEEYLLAFSPAKVVKHIALRKNLQDRNAALQYAQRNGHWSLLIIAKDRTGLLAKVCGTLALHNLNVLHAQIFTWADGTAVDVIDVQPWVEMPFDAQDWQALEQDMDLALGNQLGLDHRLVKKTFPRLGTRKMRLRPAVRVEMDNTSADFFTIIEVYADDRPKLLYDITRTLADFNLSISRAKISSKEDQLVDVFYVQDEQGDKISDSVLQKELRQSLLFAATEEKVQ